MRPILLILLLLALSPLADGQRQEYQIDAMEVRLELTEDGRYLVEEDITFGFRQGTFTQGFRVIPGRRIDGIRGVEVASGDATVTEIEHERDGGDHVILWSFPERSRPATFTLRYEVQGALVADEGENVIDWDAVGDAIEVPVENVRVHVTFPDFGLGRDDITVLPEEGVLERTETGWRVSFAHPRLAAETPYRVAVAFPRQLEGRRPAVPDIYFLYGLLGALAGIIPGILGYRRRRRTPTPRPSPPARRPNLPLPQVAGLVLNAHAFSARAYPAVLFDLARRGHLSLRQAGDEEERLEVSLHHRPGDLSPFEIAFVEELARHDSFQEFLEETGTWREERRKRVRDQQVADGLMSDLRSESNRLLGLAAGVALAGAALSFSLSGWPVAVATGATIGVALGTLVAAERRWRLTQAGADTKAEAQAFLADLRTSIEEALDRNDPATAAARLAENLPWLFLDEKIDEAWLERFSEAVEAAGEEIALPAWIGEAFGGGTDLSLALLLVTTMTTTHSASVQHGALAAGAGVSGGIGGGSVGAR